MNSIYPDNSLESCKLVVEKGFTGIEIDVRYHENKFYLHHDHWYLANNQTLQQLLELNLNVDLWVDVKTSYLHSTTKLISLLTNFKNRLLVEVYDEQMIAPLKAANITVTSTNFDTDFRSVLGIQYIFFGTDKYPHGTWDLDRFRYLWIDFNCLHDAYFADGGDVVVTDFHEPSSCGNNYISIPVVRLIIYGVPSLLILLVFCYCIFFCRNLQKRRKRDDYKPIAKF